MQITNHLKIIIDRKTWKIQWKTVLFQYFCFYFYRFYMKTKNQFLTHTALHRTNIAGSDCIEFSGWPHVLKNQKQEKNFSSFIRFYFNAFIQFLTSFHIFHCSREFHWRLLAQCCRNPSNPLVHFEHIFITIRSLYQKKS